MKRLFAIGVLALVMAATPALADNAAALVKQSRGAEARGDSNTAVILMQAAVVADPAKAASYVALADLYARLRKPDFAHKYYDEALGIDPTLQSAKAGIARVERQQDMATADASSLDKH
jgi:tetratricopeptide (TPR) repeat protein